MKKSIVLLLGLSLVTTVPVLSMEKKNGDGSLIGERFEKYNIICQKENELNREEVRLRREKEKVQCELNRLSGELDRLRGESSLNVSERISRIRQKASECFEFFLNYFPLTLGLVLDNGIVLSNLISRYNLGSDKEFMKANGEYEDANLELLKKKNERLQCIINAICSYYKMPEEAYKLVSSSIVKVLMDVSTSSDKKNKALKRIALVLAKHFLEEEKAVVFQSRMQQPVSTTEEGGEDRQQTITSREQQPDGAAKSGYVAFA